MINNKKIYVIVAGFLVLAGASAFVFYFYKTQKNNSIAPSGNDNFIQSVAQSPAVEGNIVNSGVAGKVVLLGGGPYEYEASLDVFKSDDLSKPFISVRSDLHGNFQIPMRPGSYILKPIDPDGDIAPVRDGYSFVINNGQWLVVKVEYK